MVDIKIYIKSIFKTMLSLVKYFLAILVSIFVAIGLQEHFNYSEDFGFSLTLVISTLICLLLLKLETKHPIKILNVHKINVKSIILIFTLAIVLLFFNLSLGEVLTKYFNLNIDSSDDSALYFWGVFHLIILAPICEELFFRGIVFTKLKAIIPLPLAIVIQAFLFGFLHGGLSGHILHVVVSTISGIAFAVLYDYTKNLTSSILLHVSNNTIVLLMDISNITNNINKNTAIILYLIISISALIIYAILTKSNKFKLDRGIYD